jgi:hypothetical protein
LGQAGLPERIPARPFLSGWLSDREFANEKYSWSVGMNIYKDIKI